MAAERKMILEMLQEGKITADEAERLLKAINEPEERSTEEEMKEDPISPSEFVDWDAWDERKQAYRQKSSGFKIGQYIESFIQKLKDVDLDFNFGSYETVKHIYQDNHPEFTNVACDIKNGAVHIEPWDEHAVQVNCEARVYKVQSEDEAYRRFMKNTRFEIKNDTLIFACEVNDMKVNATIYLPRKTYDDIEVRMFNGQISGSGLFTDDLNIKSVNGNLSFPNLQAKKAELETGNGTITVAGQADEIELETLNGAVDAAGAFRDLHVETFSGLVKADLSSAEAVSLRSTTGSIDVRVPRAVHINGELVSSIGSIHCELHAFEILKEKKEIAQRLLKFVCNKQADKTLALDANTKTGTITVAEREA